MEQLITHDKPYKRSARRINAGPQSKSQCTIKSDCQLVFQYINDMKKNFEPIESATESISGDEYVTVLNYSSH